MGTLSNACSRCLSSLSTRLWIFERFDSEVIRSLYRPQTPPAPCGAPATVYSIPSDAGTTIVSPPVNTGTSNTQQTTTARATFELFCLHRTAEPSKDVSYPVLPIIVIDLGCYGAVMKCSCSRHSDPRLQRGVAFEVQNTGSQPIFINSVSVWLVANSQVGASASASNVNSFM